MKQGIGQIWLSTETMVVHDNKLWFAEADSNEVYSYDLETKECSLVCVIAGEPENGKRLFGAMEICKDYLYLFPFSAKNAYKVNRFTGCVTCIKIKEPSKEIYKEYCASSKFLSCHIYKDKLFVVGATYPAILEYDIDTGKIIYHNEWIEKIVTYFNTSKDRGLFRKSIIIDDKLYAPSCRGNAILIYDISTGKFEICEVGNKSCRYSSICFDGNDFWLAPRQGDSIIRWNENGRNYVQYNEFPQNYQKGTFNDMVCLGTSIILLPGNANMFLEIDKKTGIVQEFNKEWRDIYGISGYIKEDILYIFSKHEATLITFHIEKKTFQKIRIPWSNEKSRHLNNQYIQEDEWDGLKEYLSFFERNDREKEKKYNNVHMVGKQIWNQMSKA